MEMLNYVIMEYNGKPLKPEETMGHSMLKKPHD